MGDPILARVPFMATKEQGHDVILWLWSEAMVFGCKGGVDRILILSLRGLCGGERDKGCRPCGGATIKGMPDCIRVVEEWDRSLLY